MKYCMIYISLVTALAGHLHAAEYTSGLLKNMPAARDYSCSWWANGFYYSHDPAWGPERIFCIQTGYYGLSVDVESMNISHFGPFRGSLPYPELADKRNEMIFSLPQSRLDMKIAVADRIFRFAGLPEIPDVMEHMHIPYRINSSGRLVQRFDGINLRFEDQDQNPFPGRIHLEIIAWPDILTLVLHVIPAEPLEQVTAGLKLSSRGQAVFSNEKTFGQISAGSHQKLSARYEASGPHTTKRDISVCVSDARTGLLSVNDDPCFGGYVVGIPARYITTGAFPESLCEFSVQLSNLTDKPAAVRLVFAAESSDPNDHFSLIGTAAVLTDPNGSPTGIPVQVSKNWHITDASNAPLYDKNWYHAYAMLHLDPNEKQELGLRLINGVWAGVPIVTHQHLALVGWGGHQQWDQVAIGNWNESITYDPDLGLARAMIDDVRPLLVYAMNKKPTKWTWTHNVGGGNFLFYYDEDNTFRRLVSVKTVYDMAGPNLTDVTYSGLTSDGKISARIGVSSPRTDDMNRSYHRIRYDILKPVRFARLAFYQLGADNYNINQFDKMAVGGLDGLVEEWTPHHGGRKYHRSSVPLDALPAWMSIHETTFCAGVKERGGPMANRGLIVRRWKARLGGRDVPHPYYSVYGTENQIPGANFELSVPPDITQLLPGDYVEADLELVVVPQFADDYYGPNKRLKQYLETKQNTWRPIHWEAAGNHLEVLVKNARLVRRYPIEIETQGSLPVEFTLRGGVGFIPVTFHGLKHYSGFEFYEITEGEQKPFNDSTHAQADFDLSRRTWSLTYNLEAVEKSDTESRTFLFAEQYESGEKK